MLSIIIPAHNEADWIGATLDALLAQDATAPADTHVIVAANGCTDNTAEIARGFEDRAGGRGWRLTVLEIPQGSKTGALNAADALIGGGARVYLDADILCAPPMLGQLAAVLDRPDPIYASGTFTIAPPRSWSSRHYARLWLKVPFMRTGVPGAGLFAVNPAGRARWGAFPDIIADDLFVRLNFAPEERIAVPAKFVWALAEGFGGLVKVRGRWNAGNAQLMEMFPELAVNEEKAPVRPADHLALLAGQPVSYAVYTAVAMAVKLKGERRSGWARGRA